MIAIAIGQKKTLLDKGIIANMAASVVNIIGRKRCHAFINIAINLVDLADT